MYKYIPTQYEFKCRIDKIKLTGNSLNGVDSLPPRENVFNMKTSTNRYVKTEPFEIHNFESLADFDKYVYIFNSSSEIERSRRLKRNGRGLL